ncbi:MAG: hypothetical protein K2J58_06125 [Muribaculaceae bacterium]|nr:hypothetical protein [Muribaculaceae bacterium]
MRKSKRFWHLVPEDDTEIYGGEIAGAPEPLIIDNAIKINKDILSALVYIPNVIFNEATPESRYSFTGKLGNQYMIFYNNFAIPSHPEGTYDILATVGIYYDQLEIQPVEFIYTDSVDDITVKGEEEYYNLQGQRVMHPEKRGIYIRKNCEKINKIITSY